MSMLFAHAAGFVSIEKDFYRLFHWKRLVQRSCPKPSVNNLEAIILSIVQALRGLIAVGLVPAGGSTTALSRIKKGACVHSRWPIAISYHCPVAAMRARTLRWRGRGQRGPSERRGRGWLEEGREEGTKKGQMAPSSSQPSGSGHAPTESEHLPLLPRRRAQENHRLLSSPRQKAHPPADTDRQSVAALPGPVSYFVSFPSAAFPPSLSTSSPPPFIATSVSFIPPPARRACSKIFNFGRWHVPGRRISSSSLLTPPSAILCRVSPDETTRARQIR